MAMKRPFNYFSELALGNIPGRSPTNKFGAAPSGIQTSLVDIWDLADAAPTQQIWLAPTAARIHTIASDSVEDDVGQDGTDKVRVWYLADWDSLEAYEDVEGDINGGIAMDNAAVIIHRMKAIAQATTVGVGVNVGTITATAAGDATITAVILPANGQTEMAIYGVPSMQVALLHTWHAQISRAISATVDFTLRVNENPDVQTVAFARKDDISLSNTGTSSEHRTFASPKRFDGPCIIKVQGLSSALDVDGEAGFDLELALA